MLVIGLWPLSGNYGQTFSSKYIQDFFNEALKTGFSTFDTAESYGAQDFQTTIATIARETVGLKWYTKIGVKFGETDWASQLRNDLRLIYDKYAGGLVKVYLHNPRVDVARVNAALAIMKEELKETAVEVAVSLPKGLYSDVTRIKADAVQLDVNPTYCNHVDLIAGSLDPANIDARSIFGSGLLGGNNSNFSSADQRARWVTSDKIASGKKVKEIGISIFGSEAAYIEALILFPKIWGISNVVVGTSKSSRFSALFEVQKKGLSVDYLNLLSKFKTATSDIECF